MQESSEQNVPQSNDSQNQTSKTVDPIAPAPIPAGASGGLSGQGVNAMPEETKGWSWAGFFLTWIWGVFNGVWISLLAFVVPWPIMNISWGLRVKSGFGRERNGIASNSLKIPSTNRMLLE